MDIVCTRLLGKWVGTGATRCTLVGRRRTAPLVLLPFVGCIDVCSLAVSYKPRNNRSLWPGHLIEKGLGGPSVDSWPGVGSPPLKPLYLVEVVISLQETCPVTLLSLVSIYERFTEQKYILLVEFQIQPVVKHSTWISQLSGLCVPGPELLSCHCVSVLCMHGWVRQGAEFKMHTPPSVFLECSY